MRGRIVAEGKAGAVMQKTACNSTRPNTQPSVADRWAQAEMRVFTLFYSIVTDGLTDGWRDGQTDRKILL